MHDLSAIIDVRLTCLPGKQGDMLVFPYQMENHGTVGVYVMDAIPSVEPGTREARADDGFVVVIHAAAEDALVGKIPPPLPTDRQMLVPILPLARLLGAGEKLAREIRIPMPLAECNPYLPELTLRQYQSVALMGVTFAVSYWPVTAPGVLAAPAPYSPDHYVVHAKGAAPRMSQHFPVKGLPLFRRKDAFPREAA